VAPPVDLFGRREPVPVSRSSTKLFCAGRYELVRERCIAIVGTREVSEAGKRRAAKLAAILASKGVVVVSGLALGVDTAAHTAALEYGGKTIAVIGTPLDKVNPTSNSALQELIWNNHLLISQFEWGSNVFPSNFPQRNKVMAAICDATVIIEASDTSGTLHQATECVRLERPLFITRSVVEDKRLSWPEKFLSHPTVHILEDVEDVFRRVYPKAED
jgi:DNA processing protein